MKPLLQCVAFLLAAVWLPAAQHCQLEALDIIAAHECHAGGGGAEEAHGKRSHEAPCAHENHNEIEGGSYSFFKDNTGAPIPLLSPCLCLTCLYHFLSEAADARPAELLSPSPDHREHPQDWVPAWTFARRAAPSPRAPSHILV
ncbi:hypothetical protein OH491_27205 [Termitidicoccus mucosus]|uniref:Cobalt transporter n=1 Tax=Termitidicoccus mucosus TaxID=1184151 RepID=A0A178IBM6_9BACT|nr:hypothetical protein AW736_23565 [Opitutaceae bacterium TSB47]